MGDCRSEVLEGVPRDSGWDTFSQPSLAIEHWYGIGVSIFWNLGVHAKAMFSRDRRGVGRSAIARPRHNASDVAHGN